MTRVRFAALAGSFALAAVLASCYGKSEAPTGAELDSGNLAPGGTQYAHTFSTAGTFPYHCALHPGCAGLRGSVVVTASGPAIAGNRHLAVSQTSGGGCWVLSAALDSVKTGDRVTWTNDATDAPHTVTSYTP